MSLSIAAAGFAAADVIRPPDSVLPVGSTSIDLGVMAPGATIEYDLPLVLRCTNSTHVSPGAVITVSDGVKVVPLDGALAFASTTIGPVPHWWPATGSPCPSPASELAAAIPAKVSITAPTIGGVHAYSLALVRDTTGTANSSVTFELEVVANTAPTLDVPADFEIEGDTTGGWSADFTTGASDAEDTTDPAVVCSPSVGSLLPLGATTIECSAIDEGGLTTSGSFTVTVTDPTPPSFAIDPGDVAVEATSASGAVAAFVEPGASDIVDPAPTVSCDPPSGSTFGVGTTVVTCTARDATGNTTSTNFQVVVHARQSSPIVAWGEPVGAASTVFANRGRTLPLKASIALDGSPVGSTAVVQVALVRLEACDGVRVETRSGPVMTWDGGRWSANLDTSNLGAGCWRVSAAVDGSSGGTFELRVVDGNVGGASPAATKNRSRRD